MISIKKLSEGNTYIKYRTILPNNLKLSKTHYEELWDMHPKNFGQIKIFNKLINTPRWFQNYGHNYNFSNMNHSSLDIPSILQPFINFVNKSEPTINYNGILVNWYENGSHYIGKHSDDEKDLIPNSPIYCFSFGSERNFILESKSNKDTKYKYTLLNNSLIVMGGECQKYYKHSIPKSKTNNSRISITIRAFKT